MGSIYSKNEKVYFLNDGPQLKTTSLGFSPNMFENLEWTALKRFCNKNNITQIELNYLFKKFASYDDAHVQMFRVRVSDLRESYIKKTRLTVVSTERTYFLLLLIRIFSCINSDMYNNGNVEMVKCEILRREEYYNV